DEGEARDPGGQGAAGEEELDRGGDAALGVPAHTEHEGEVQRDDRVVDPLGVESEVDHEAVPWGRGRGAPRHGVAGGGHGGPGREGGGGRGRTRAGWRGRAGRTRPHGARRRRTARGSRRRPTGRGGGGRP